MARYRKKPVVIDAMQYDGTNAHAVCEWALKCKIENPFALIGGFWIKQVITNENITYKLAIDTLEGTMHANPEDWIIRGINDELYPCKPDIFEATYELVEGD